MRKPALRAAGMSATAAALTLSLSVGAAGAIAPPLTISSGIAVASAAVPQRELSVSGTGVASYPAFDPAVTRYAITTGSGTAGEVSVTATTTDAAGSVRINGRPAPQGTATLTGLTEGDEIGVEIADSAGTTTYALVYLPAGFPALEVDIDDPRAEPGMVGLGLLQFNYQTPSFEAVVDRAGVPVYVASQGGPMDLKSLGDGRYSVSRPTSTPSRTGERLAILDDTFTEVRAQETVAGLTNTDGHDSWVFPNGDVLLLSYDADPDTGFTDAVLQRIDLDGNEVFRWDSGNVPPDNTSLYPETVNDLDFIAFQHDYAHVNSVWVMADGNLLVSFRHLSSVLKIAAETTADHVAGEVLWRFGGRMSDFEFPAGDGGPCAQHSASELPNGNILLYDNGSDAVFTQPMCIDPTDPGGDPLARASTRVTEWQLTPPAAGQPGQAQIAWNYDTGMFAFFAGHSQRLPGGNTMIGYAATIGPMAEEVTGDAVPEVVWRLRAPFGDNGVRYTTYRAFKFDAPDKIAPTIGSLSDPLRPGDPAAFTQGQRVVVDFACTDRGGSTLRQCGGTYRPGDLLDTSQAGAHSFTVSAVDGAGNTTTRKRGYSVVAAPTTPDSGLRPDVSIKRKPAGSWVGRGRFGKPSSQQIRQRVGRGGRALSVVRIKATGSGKGRFTVDGRGSSRGFVVSYRSGGRNVTRKVVAGNFRTKALAAGRSVRLRVQVRRGLGVRPGVKFSVPIRVRSGGPPIRRDAARTVVTAR